MFTSYILIGLVRALVGAVPRHVGERSKAKQIVYFANHSSHIDTIALWSALDPERRARTRPVAAADYWGKGALRRHIALKGLNVVLIDRTRQTDADPLQPLRDALVKGDSLIIFPEGTRQVARLPGAFKAGIYHLFDAFPEVDFVPVFLDNLHRSMPKGSLIPVPVICTVRIGSPLTRIPGEGKGEFLVRARQSIIDLS